MYAFLDAEEQQYVMTDQSIANKLKNLIKIVSGTALLVAALACILLDIVADRQSKNLPWSSGNRVNYC
jgi:hypothetical protein